VSYDLGMNHLISHCFIFIFILTQDSEAEEDLKMRILRDFRIFSFLNKESGRRERKAEEDIFFLVELSQGKSKRKPWFDFLR